MAHTDTGAQHFWRMHLAIEVADAPSLLQEDGRLHFSTTSLVGQDICLLRIRDSIFSTSSGVSTPWAS